MGEQDNIGFADACNTPLEWKDYRKRIEAENAALRALVGRMTACLEPALVVQQQLKKMATTTGIGWAIMDCESEMRAALAAVPAELRGEKGEKL